MAVSNIEIKTTPTRILVSNPKRIAFMVINDSTVDVYVGYDKNVSTTGKTKGVPIKPNGGYWAYEFHKGELWAIADSETDLIVVENSEGEV